jgi:predicted Zn-ribbon and HTH transcriptional regulator
MIEIQDIFRKYGEEYRENHKLPQNHYKVMRNIERCRTEALGGHVDKCDECGYIQISYNSCRDRHCPKCQTLSKERWIAARKDDLLPVQYFHVVFTIPEILNPIVFQNQKVVYTILFRAASETLSELAQDKKYLGAQLGFISILHTWGQNLMHHPHIHCIVPGGGLSACNKWVDSKKKFFLPVKVLSRKFRGKFLFYLKKAYYENTIHFYGLQEHLINERDYESLLSSLYRKEWVSGFFITTFCRKV